MHNTDMKHGELKILEGGIAVLKRHGKYWARGYTQERRDTFFVNLGTDNGTKRFDWRLFFRNLADTTSWYMYNPGLYTLEYRQKMMKKDRYLW